MFKGPNRDIEAVLTAPVSAVCGVTLDASGKKEYLISGTYKQDQTRKNEPAMSRENLVHARDGPCLSLHCLNSAGSVTFLHISFLPTVTPERFTLRRQPEGTHHYLRLYPQNLRSLSSLLPFSGQSFQNSSDIIEGLEWLSPGFDLSAQPELSTDAHKHTSCTISGRKIATGCQ